MKPIIINLKKKGTLHRRLFISFSFVFAVAAFAITLVNIYDFFAYKRIIRAYEARVEKAEQQLSKQSTAARQDRTGADGRQIAEDALFLDKIYVKHLRSIPEMLSNLEKAKPDKVQIDEVVFSKDMRAVTLIGSSYSPGAISQFLDQLSLNDGMALDLSREEIGENKLIRFELTARWINGSDASKI